MQLVSCFFSIPSPFLRALAMADPQHRRLTGVSLEGDVKWGQSGGVLPFGPRDQQNRGFHKGNRNAEIWIQVCACACASVRTCVCARGLLSC